MDIEKQTGEASWKTMEDIQWQKAVRTWSILVKLFGLNISVNQAKIFNLIHDGGSHNDIIGIMTECKKICDVSDVFLAVLAADRSKFCEFCQQVRAQIVKDDPASKMTDEFILGSALGVFLAGCELDAYPNTGPETKYDDTVTDLTAAFLQISNKRCNRIYYADRPVNAYRDQLSKAIKEYFRADCFATQLVKAKRWGRKNQAMKIFSDFSQWLTIAGDNSVSELGEYIMAQIVYAVLSPMSVEDRVRFMAARI